MCKGFIKIPRALFESGMWTRKRAYSAVEAYMDLVQLADYSDGEARGRVVTTYRELAARWGRDVSWAKRLALNLEDAGVVTCAPLAEGRGMTLVRLTDYDCKEETPKKDATQRATQDATQRATLSAVAVSKIQGVVQRNAQRNAQRYAQRITKNKEEDKEDVEDVKAAGASRAREACGGAERPAPATVQAAAPGSEAERERSWRRLRADVEALAVRPTVWSEQVCLRHGLRDIGELRRRLLEFVTSCIARGQPPHLGDRDLRTHIDSWLRLALADEKRKKHETENDTPAARGNARGGYISKADANRRVAEGLARTIRAAAASAREPPAGGDQLPW